MPQFVLGIIIGFFFAMCWAYNDDHTAVITRQDLSTGEALCAPHEGLKAFDASGDYTCVNGILIHNTPSKREIPK